MREPLLDSGLALDVSSPPPWVRVQGQVKGFSAPATRGANTNRVTMIGPPAGEILEAAINADGTFRQRYPFIPDLS